MVIERDKKPFCGRLNIATLARLANLTSLGLCCASTKPEEMKHDQTSFICNSLYSLYLHLLRCGSTVMHEGNEHRAVIRDKVRHSCVYCGHGCTFPGCVPSILVRRGKLTAATLVWIRHRFVSTVGALIVTRAVLWTTMALQVGAPPLLQTLLAGSSTAGCWGVTWSRSSHHFQKCTHAHTHTHTHAQTEQCVPYTKVCSTSRRTPTRESRFKATVA